MVVTFMEQKIINGVLSPDGAEIERPLIIVNT